MINTADLVKMVGMLQGLFRRLVTLLAEKLAESGYLSIPKHDAKVRDEAMLDVADRIATGPYVPERLSRGIAAAWIREQVANSTSTRP